MKIQLERADVVPMIAEVFRDHGYAGTSLSIITACTGIGKGSLYHFFPGGKVEMVEAVLAHISCWFEERVFAPLEMADVSFVAIEAMLDTVNAYFQSGRRVCLIGLMALDSSRDEFSAAISGYFRRWNSVLRNAFVKAGFTETEAGQRSHEILAGIQGGLVLARALNDPTVFSMRIEKLRSDLGVPARSYNEGYT
ncbi:TetR family transcriptional regulator [Agrobacterium vitis]|uniref:TetR family transcriptional regulator n=1 Tax=Agrobacterium vitis TaxID=373 RepID=A0A6L6VIZ4_AGRVI|nr:TetR/AcrR family transcriptional regulator [Agrobacterium vitis]MUZ75800.1 TetR family transcriptional regulator [Agrobacterium vitis]